MKNVKLITKVAVTHHGVLFIYILYKRLFDQWNVIKTIWNNTNNACYSNIFSLNRLYIIVNGNWLVVDSA